MELAEVLADRWNLKADRFEVLEGGMNSQTWLVVAPDGGNLVLKTVGASDGAFGPGLEAAARLERAGVLTGAPVPSRAGRLVETYGDRQLAVLQYIDGRPLVGTADDRRAIGTTLGRVHGVTQLAAGELEDWLGLVRQFDEYLDLEPWIRPAVNGAIDGVRDLAGRQPLTWAGLHGDPAPEAFLRQADGQVALIDWGGFKAGPLLYDLGSAFMYLGTKEPFLSAYLAERPALATEVATGLPVFLRFRFAVQAVYFAWRVSNDVLTGLSDAEGNLKGLNDARRGLGC